MAEEISSLEEVLEAHLPEDKLKEVQRILFGTGAKYGTFQDNNFSLLLSQCIRYEFHTVVCENY